MAQHAAGLPFGGNRKGRAKGVLRGIGETIHIDHADRAGSALGKPHVAVGPAAIPWGLEPASGSNPRGVAAGPTATCGLPRAEPRDRHDRCE